MNPLLLLGLGAGLIFLSGSSKSSSKKEDNKTQSNSGKIPTQGSIKSGTSNIPQPKDVICSNFELKKDGKCVSFWNDTVKKKVTDKIIAKAYEFMTTPYIGSVSLPREGVIGEDYIPILCLKTSPTTMNPNAEKIIFETILETWGDIKKSDLPPKSTAPLWIRLVWSEVVKIYVKEICKNEPLL